MRAGCDIAAAAVQAEAEARPQGGSGCMMPVEAFMNETRVRTLAALVETAARIRGIQRADVRRGDRLLVSTRNSLYSIACLGGDVFRVSGGFFDRQGTSPVTTSIRGCTWGGSAIHTNLVAGCGLFLEFGNDVRTTRILQIRWIRVATGTATRRVYAACRRRGPAPVAPR